jgi:uracil DNA glycosylase
MKTNDIIKWIENNSNEYIKAWLDNDKIKSYFKNEDLLSCINSCTSPRISDLSKDIQIEDLERIFNAFSLFKPEDTNILIIGQDPYPNSEKSQGFAFSCQKGKAASLTKIFEAVDIYTKKEKEHNYNLINWAKENNVLLLNASLTYESKDKVKTNIEAWKPFITKIVENLFEINSHFIIFLWGKKAQNLYKECNHPASIRIFETCHPNNRHDREKFKKDVINHFEVCDETLNKDIWKSL